MTTLQNYLDQTQRLVHDVTNATFTQAELIDYINEAREDVAIDMHCVRTFFTGVQLIQGQEIYPINGAVVGANVTSGGLYAVVPTAVFDAAPLGGVTAQGTVVTTGTAPNLVVTGINMTQWGSGYLGQPNITFNTGGVVPPAAATATSIFMNNVLSTVSITNIWNMQRYVLSFRGFTLFQAYMRAWTTMFQSRPGIWTVHPQMQQIYMRPMPDQLYFSEWDVITLPNPLVNTTDVDNQVILPWNKAVQFRAAEFALLKNQNFEQANHYGELYAARVPRIITGTGGYRIPNPYNRSFQRRVARQ